MDDKLLDDTYQQTFEGVVKNDLTIRRLKRVHTLSKLRCLASNNNLTRAVETSVTLKMLCKNIWVISKSRKKVIDVPGKIENFFLPFKTLAFDRVVAKWACFWKAGSLFQILSSKIIKLSFLFPIGLFVCKDLWLKNGLLCRKVHWFFFSFL